MNGEEEKLTAFVMSPGWVQTELGNVGAKFFGFDEAPTSLDESCDRMVPLIEGATKEKHGGKLIGFEGDQLIW
jgi:hypothetical protein